MTCADCKYAEVVAAELGTLEYTICRRNPPAVTVFPGNLETLRFESYFPKVSPQDWCGEWKQKPGP